MNNPQAHLGVSLLLMLLACHFNTVFSDQPKTLNLFTPLYHYTVGSRNAQGCSDGELHNCKEKNLKMSHSCLLGMIWVCNAVKPLQHVESMVLNPSTILHCTWFSHWALVLAQTGSKPVQEAERFSCGFISQNWSLDRSDECQCWSMEECRNMQH